VVAAFLLLVAGGVVLVVLARLARSPQTERTLRRAASVALSIVGSLLLLYGLFACTYQGDGGSETTVGVTGHQIDAAFAGIFALVLAFAAFWAAVRALRPRNRGAQ
jgi:hypothetical protein